MPRQRCRSARGAGTGDEPHSDDQTRSGDRLRDPEQARASRPNRSDANLEIVKTASPSPSSSDNRSRGRSRSRTRDRTPPPNVVVEDTLPDDISFVDGSLDVPLGRDVRRRTLHDRLAGSGASVTGSFVTTATAVGTKTNTVTVDADQEDPNPADNTASAQVLVTGGARRSSALSSSASISSRRHVPRALRLPEPGQRRGRRAHRRAQRSTPAPRTAASRCASSPAAPPTSSRSIPRHARWTLTGDVDGERELEALRSTTGGCGSTRSCARPTTRAGSTSRSTASPPVPARRRAPRDDRRRRGARRAHRVGEEGVRRNVAGGLRHDDRLPRQPRPRRGPVGRPGPGVVVDVAAGQEVVCTIENTRRTGPPVPPLPPPPGPRRPTPARPDRRQPPPSPQPGTSDLAVQKFVDRRIGALGEIVTVDGRRHQQRPAARPPAS